MLEFFLSCIIIGLEYIHSKKVMHRDIKPENLVLDDKGYVRVTDFGIAKVMIEDNSSETSGTPGYMSPEVMEGANHTHIVDYYALGIIGYEFMTGKRPYQGRNRKEMKEYMINNQVQLRAQDIPRGWSYNSVDFINKLLIRKPELRLGYNSINELKMHPWYIKYPWTDITLKRFRSPFIPKQRENFDKRYCQEIDRVGIATRQRYENYLKNPKYKEIFENFTFYNIIPSTSNHQEQKKNTTAKSISISIITKTNSYNTISVNALYPKSVRNNSVKSSFVQSLHQSDSKIEPNLKNKRSCRYQNAFNYSMKLIEQQRNKQKASPILHKRNATTQNLSNSLSHLSLYKSKLLNSSKRSLSSFPKQFPNECFNQNKSTGHIKYNKRNNRQLNDSNPTITINIKKPAPIMKALFQTKTIAEKIHTIQRSKSNFGSLSIQSPSKSDVEYANQLQTPTYHRKVIHYNCKYEKKGATQIDLNKIDPPMFVQKEEDTPGASFEQLKSLKNIRSNSPKKIVINKRNNLSSSNSTLPSNSRGNKESNNT